MSSAQYTVSPATAAEPPSTLRVKQSRKKPDTSSQWKCLQCCKHFSNKYILGKHNKKCSRTTKNSPVNDRSSQSSNIQNKACPTTTVANVLKPRPRHSCSACDKSFVDKSDLVYHIKSYHPSIDVDAVCPMRKKSKNLVCPGKQTFVLFEHTMIK